MDVLNNILMACAELDEELTGLTKGDNARQKRIRQHLDTVTSELYYKVPDFDKGLHWMNTSSPISLHENLKGNIVIMDFFTYCCINCMHVLPDLEAVENKFTLQDGVVILGVHSAKFENEKVSSNILSAILRYNIHHPVVNDHDAVLWNQLQISCWPTFVVIGPGGQFLYNFVGEGHRENLMEFIEVCLEYFKTKIVPSSVRLSLEKDRISDSPLQFPGKITSSKDGKQLVVSDTGHHRILILSVFGVVQHCIGGSKRGYKDGSFKEARFNSPQGVVIVGNIVYVADTDNHVIRQINLETKTVITVAGTGAQGQDKEGGNMGTSQELSSPWDVVLGSSSDSETDNLLYIAMAGTHQIWVYFIQDGDWLKSSRHTAGTCLRFSGSGQEENRNNSYPTKAGFAQPSGLALSKSLNLLFVADSESSTIRKVSLKDGGVKALVGGEFDPTNLFAYGDADGKGHLCKLQHPLGVTLVSEEGPLLVADSYNHKIRLVDITTATSTTLVGPKPGNGDIQCRLNEPGGLCMSLDNKVYIADTNNHHIKILDLNTKTMQKLPVIFPDDQLDSLGSKEKPDVKLRGPVEDLEELVLPSTGSLIFTLDVTLPEGSYLTTEIHSTWILLKETNDGLIEKARRDIDNIDDSYHLVANISEDHCVFYCFCKVLYCGKEKLCKMSQKTYKQVVKIDPTASDRDRTVAIHLMLK